MRRLGPDLRRGSDARLDPVAGGWATLPTAYEGAVARERGTTRMTITTPARAPRRLGRLLAAAALATTMLGSAASVASADAGATTAAAPQIIFSVSDGESPEGFRVFDPGCPPDIYCKPHREAGRITFAVSTNMSLAGVTLKVRYRTVAGTAVAPGDYTATTGLLTFPPGVFTRYVTVWMNINAGGVEPPEQFSLQLFEPNPDADVSDVGVGTIYDGVEDVGA
jgi:hypothetical protein